MENPRNVLRKRKRSIIKRKRRLSSTPVALQVLQAATVVSVAAAAIVRVLRAAKNITSANLLQVLWAATVVSAAAVVIAPAAPVAIATTRNASITRNANIITKRPKNTINTM